MVKNNIAGCLNLLFTLIAIIFYPKNYFLLIIVRVAYNGFGPFFLIDYFEEIGLLLNTITNKTKIGILATVGYIIFEQVSFSEFDGIVILIISFMIIFGFINLIFLQNFKKNSKFGNLISLIICTAKFGQILSEKINIIQYLENYKEWIGAAMFIKAIFLNSKKWSTINDIELNYIQIKQVLLIEFQKGKSIEELCIYSMILVFMSSIIKFFILAYIFRKYNLIKLSNFGELKYTLGIYIIYIVFLHRGIEMFILAYLFNYFSSKKIRKNAKMILRRKK